MKHLGLKLRMVVAGTILFGLYVSLATVVYSATGSLALVAVGTILFVGIQYALGKWLALRSVGAQDLPETDYPEIHRTVEQLSNDMGIAKPQVKYASMGVPNAFAVGRKGAGTVVIGTELMTLLDDDELEGVIAHELAHIKNNDVVLMLLGQSVAILIGWSVYFAVQQLGEGIVGWILAMAASMLAQLLVMVFVLVISRTREYAADSDAIEYTDDPEALASALAKIGAVGQHDDAPDVDKSVGALCIFGGKRGLLSLLFATHPPIEKRIEAVSPGFLART